MTTCAVNKIDSNVTGLHIAEEVCPGILPTLAADGFDPVWYEQEPNSYPDFGGDLTTIARTPISASRQRKKGTVTGLEATGGFQTDLTQNNVARLMQGFFFADARQKSSTKPFNGEEVAIDSVADADDSFNAANGLDRFAPGQLIKASGFAVNSNNGLHLVVTAGAGKVTVASSLANEADPPAAAKLELVGYEFASGALSVGKTAAAVTLTASGGVDWTTFGLVTGEWVGVGGDTTGTRFADPANEPGFGRIAAITPTVLTLDETTFVGAVDAGAGKTVRVFFGTVVKNEKEVSLIKTRSYQLERTLGTDASGDTQAQYIEGAVPNELTINIPEREKVTIDLSYIGMNDSTRTGVEGLKDGVRVPALGEDAFNTSSNVFRQKLSLVDPNNINAAPLFAFLTEATVTIGNNVSPVTALGRLGAVDVSIGNFDVGGSITALFQTVEALRAIRSNADVGFNIIISARNAGVVIDIPLLGVGGGRAAIELNRPITIPLDMSGAENRFGYTMLMNFFPYLPNSLMPD